MPVKGPLVEPIWGKSGVEPCFFTECNDLSFELARLLPAGFSPASGMLASEDCNLWEDLEAIKFEKNPLDASRPCFGDCGTGPGEGGNSGIAVILGEFGPDRYPPLTLWDDAERGFISDGVGGSCKKGEPGAEPGVCGEPVERGLNVAGVRPFNSSLFFGDKLRKGKPEALGIFVSPEMSFTGPTAGSRPPFLSDNNLLAPGQWNLDILRRM